MENSNSFCLFCGKKLRKIYKNCNPDEKTAFHSKCFKEMIFDIKNFDKICFEKYNYKRLYDGKTKEEWKNTEEKVVVKFD